MHITLIIMVYYQTIFLFLRDFRVLRGEQTVLLSYKRAKDKRLN